MEQVHIKENGLCVYVHKSIATIIYKAGICRITYTRVKLRKRVLPVNIFAVKATIHLYVR